MAAEDADFAKASNVRDVSAADPAAAAAQSTAQVATLVKSMAQAQCVSLCFVLDTTGSMQPHIDGVHRQMADILSKIEAASCFIRGLPFVGYKDWSDGTRHFEVLHCLLKPLYCGLVAC